MQYGFVIDHERCIGCHACTVACKAENDVPVGGFRTSVKYTESGRYPEVSRSFLVQRCNHCNDAPCVTICPVNALEKRADGIVDVDRDACIGCRACMQACPYDALYLNEDRGAVEKCHFCAHRIDVGLEPACVTVCPVGAIIPGDMHDPTSAPGRIVAMRQTAVRRAEQGTGPNVHYVGADERALRPGTAARPPMYLWSDRPPDRPEPWPDGVATAEDTRVVLDVPHHIEWGWPIAAYLVTKSIAAGAALAAPFVGRLGVGGAMGDYAPEIVAILFTMITVGILVEDLARPWRFYRMLTRPNLSSWLVKGGILLTVSSVLLVTAIIARAAGATLLADVIRWVNAVVALGVAGYTAFLFAQCKGRDLWESALLLPHLIVQSVAVGSVITLPLAPESLTLKFVALGALVGHLALAITERARRHESENARQAAGFLTSVKVGPLAAWRDGLVIGVGFAIALVIVLPAAAFLPAVAGLLLYEHAFVRAGQLPPLS